MKKIINIIISFAFVFTSTGVITSMNIKPVSKFNKQEITSKLNSSINNNNKSPLLSGARYVYQDKDGGIWYSNKASNLFYQIDEKAKLQKISVPVVGTETNQINSIFEDSNKKIWIMTQLGLFLSGKTKTEFSKDQGNFYSGSFHNAIEDTSNTLWFTGAAEGKLYTASTKDNKVTEKQSEKFKDNSSQIGVITESANKKLYFINDKGLWCKTVGGDSDFELISKQDGPLVDIIPCDIFNFKDDMLSVITDTGTFTINPNTNEITRTPFQYPVSTSITGASMYQENGKNKIALYVNLTGSDNKSNFGLYISTDGANYTKANILNLNNFKNISNFLVLSSNKVILSTYSDITYTSSSPDDYDYKIDNIVPVKSVTCLTVFVSKENNIYVGTENSGLYKSENNGNFHKILIFKNDRINKIIENTKTNQVYVATNESGLFVEKSSGFEVATITKDDIDNKSSSISTIYQDLTGVMWLSVKLLAEPSISKGDVPPTNAIYKWEVGKPNAEKVLSDNQITQSINVFYMDPHNTKCLWMGGIAGIFTSDMNQDGNNQLDYTRAAMNTINPDFVNKGQAVNSIIGDKNGNIWVVVIAMTGGLFESINGKANDFIQTKDTTIKDVDDVNNLFYYNNTLYVATGQGIYISENKKDFNIIPETKGSVFFTIFVNKNYEIFGYGSGEGVNVLYVISPSPWKNCVPAFIKQLPYKPLSWEGYVPTFTKQLPYGSEKWLVSQGLLYTMSGVVGSVILISGIVITVMLKIKNKNKTNIK